MVPRPPSVSAAHTNLQHRLHDLDAITEEIEGDLAVLKAALEVQASRVAEEHNVRLRHLDGQIELENIERRIVALHLEYMGGKRSRGSGAARSLSPTDNRSSTVGEGSSAMNLSPAVARGELDSDASSKGCSRPTSSSPSPSLLPPPFSSMALQSTQSVESGHSGQSVASLSPLPPSHLPLSRPTTPIQTPTSIILSPASPAYPLPSPRRDTLLEIKQLELKHQRKASTLAASEARSKLEFEVLRKNDADRIAAADRALNDSHNRRSEARRRLGEAEMMFGFAKQADRERARRKMASRE